jgi:hypothetical protein
MNKPREKECGRDRRDIDGAGPLRAPSPVIPRLPLPLFYTLGLFFCHENRRNFFSRNISRHLPDYMASRPKWLRFRVITVRSPNMTYFIQLTFLRPVSKTSPNVTKSLTEKHPFRIQNSMREQTLKWNLGNGCAWDVDWIRSGSCPVQTQMLAVLTVWDRYQNVCSFLFADLNSNDSYGTVVNLGLEQDGSSPHSAGSRAPHFSLHGGPATPPYLSSSHSPTPPHPALGPNFPYSTGEGLAVYTTLGKSHIWLCDAIR